MRQTLQIQLIQTLLDLVESRNIYSSDESSRNPTEVYTSPSRFERERDTLFRKFPLIVGFSSQIPSCGDYFTHDYTGVPILVVRCDDGGLSASINVCRHRGARVVKERSGNAKSSFVCPFHGWSYRSDGRLAGITSPSGFPNLDPIQYGLVRLPVAERHGLVFVQPAPGPDFDIDAFLGPLFDDLTDFGMKDFVMSNRTVRTKKLNWKLQMDTSHENYHFHYLHAKTAGTAYFNNLGYSDYSKPHSRSLAPQRSILTLRSADPMTWRISDHVGILYSVFPNTGIYMFGGFAHVLATYPVDESSSVMMGAMLVPANATPELQNQIKLHYQSYWQTMTEDIDAAEDMQAMMSSGANRDFIFGSFESLLTKFHETVNEVIAETWSVPRLRTGAASSA
jgi:phenylpropionate dioxygenase-like ring-hydroxylating dioxygenase large terminal subunit